MVVKNRRLRQKGSVDFILIIICLLAVAFGFLGVYSFLKRGHLRDRRQFLDVSAMTIHDNLVSIIANTDAWEFTQKNNSAFDCINTRQSCTGLGGPFVLSDASQKPFSDYTDPKLGFTLSGEVCHTFDAVNGNDDCPFKVDMKWLPDCLADPSPTCRAPKINLRSTMIFKSKGYNDVPFNPLRAEINFSRDAILPTSTAFKNVQIFDVPGDYTWTVPAGITSLMVDVWGGGGGGATGGIGYQAPSSTPKGFMYLAGGGGGGGAYSKSILTATDGIVPGANYVIHVGKGGIGGASTYDVATGIWTIPFGGNGDVSWFGSGLCSGGTTGLPIFARGGDGGEPCRDWPCNNANGNGLGGKGGKGNGAGGGCGDVTQSGRAGGKYNDIFDKADDPANNAVLGTGFKWIVRYWGGRGGSAGGAGGAGGSNNNHNGNPAAVIGDGNETPPTAPGGGGAGREAGVDPVTYLQTPSSGQTGADGKVVIWY
jgi:hypothetical protein